MFGAGCSPTSKYSLSSPPSWGWRMERRRETSRLGKGRSFVAKGFIPERFMGEGRTCRVIVVPSDFKYPVDVVRLCKSST
jgi:hypothetical protein